MKVERTEKACAQLANEWSRLLNTTVTTGIRLSSTLAVNDRERPVYVVSYVTGNAKAMVTRGGLIPLSVGQKPPRMYLSIESRLTPDRELKYLMNASSIIGIYSTCEDESVLAHFDYEREKEDGYPEAHTHINASSASWDRVIPGGKDLQRLHIPVGPRRFRPSLEDIVEFLIVEDLVDVHPGWQSALKDSRDKYGRLQLQAAVRRQPEVAVSTLEDLGYQVKPPRVHLG